MAKNEEKIEWGKRMIKISVQFWTDSLPPGVDEKTAWAKGAIHMIANKQRGLKHNHVFFNTIDELLLKMQELFKKNGVKLIKSERYVEVDLAKTGGQKS